MSVFTFFVSHVYEEKRITFVKMCSTFHYQYNAELPFEWMWRSSFPFTQGIATSVQVPCHVLTSMGRFLK